MSLSSTTLSEPAGDPVLTGRSWAALFLLLLLQITWSLDRSLPLLLVEPLRHAFKLSDSQLGLAVGLVYGIAYGVGGIIVGPLLDKFNRVRMLSAMVVCWSGFTALCGLVTTFPLLLAARLGVGAAESGGSPACYAIIADLFPKHRRATAIGLFKVGSPFGVLLASVIAAVVASKYGWQAAFLVAGIPGMLLAVAVLFVIPGGRGAAVALPHPPFKLGEALAFMARSPGLAWLMIGVIVFMLAGAGSAAFQMSLFQRVHGLSLSHMSWFYGAGHALGCLGPIIAALISDRLARRDTRLSLHLLSAICLLCLGFGMVMALAESTPVALGAMILWQLAASSMSAPAFALILTLTPPQMRGTVTGFLSAAMYLLGIGPAPFIAGLLSDAMGGGTMVRYAIVVMLLINLVAVVFFTLSFRALRARPGEVERGIGSPSHATA